MRRWWPWKRDKQSPETVVIGWQLAAAHEEEERVRAAHPGVQSPFTERYDFWAGETDLTRFVPSPVDDRIAAFIEDSRNLPEGDLQRMSVALTLDDFYSLDTFAKRAALITLRTGDLTWAARAVQAIGLIDPKRVDERDVLQTAALVAHAVRRVRSDSIAREEPATLLAITELLSQVERAGPVDLREWGLQEVTTSYGLGLAASGLDTFEPRLALMRAAVDIADLLDADEYRTTSITVGDSLPAVWFPKATRERVENIIAAARAGMTVAAQRRPGSVGNPDAQHFVVFLVETKGAASARALAEWSNHNPDAFHAALAIDVGELFLLVVARSFVENQEAMESTESLERFRAPMTSVLEKVSRPGG